LPKFNSKLSATSALEARSQETGHFNLTFLANFVRSDAFIGGWGTVSKGL